MSAAISIFMPVYNGSKYLARTLTSILTQTFRDFEVVCVDDSSTDDSMQILQSYAQQDTRIKVFTKPNGGNVPKSWIFALPHFTGEYILYTSQDDLMSTDLLEKAYNRAKETEADAVIPDMAEYHGEGKVSPPRIGCYGDRKIELNGREAFLRSLKWEIHAFVLWKAELVKRIGFDDIATNSDEYATRNFFLNSNKVVFSEGTFYYGKENPDAITKAINIKRFDWCITNLRLLQLIKDNHFGEKELARFNYDFWGHTVYMNSLLKKYRKNLTRTEYAQAFSIIRKCYAAIDFNLIARYKGTKGTIIKLLFAHGNRLAQFAVSTSLLFNSKHISA